MHVLVASAILGNSYAIPLKKQCTVPVVLGIDYFIMHHTTSTTDITFYSKDIMFPIRAALLF